MLGNRTINGHEIYDSQCGKTFLLQIQEPVERDDANVTVFYGGSQRKISDSRLLSFVHSVFLTYCIHPSRKQHSRPDL